MLTQHSQSLGMMFCAGMGGEGKGKEEEGGNGRTGKRIDGENLLGSRQIKIQLQEIFTLFSEFWFGIRLPLSVCA